MARDGSFHCELEKSKDKDKDKDKDESGNQVTTIKCHGELVIGTAGAIKNWSGPSFLLAATSLSTWGM